MFVRTAAWDRESNCFCGERLPGEDALPYKIEVVNETDLRYHVLL